MRTKFAKTDMRYWERKVAFQTPCCARTRSRSSGRISAHGDRTRHGEQGSGGDRGAVKLYIELKANGWDETMRDAQA